MITSNKFFTTSRKKLLVARCLTSSNKKLLVALGITTSSSWHYYYKKLIATSSNALVTTPAPKSWRSLTAVDVHTEYSHPSPPKLPRSRVLNSRTKPAAAKLLQTQSNPVEEASRRGNRPGQSPNRAFERRLGQGSHRVCVGRRHSSLVSKSVGEREKERKQTSTHARKAKK